MAVVVALLAAVLVVVGPRAATPEAGAAAVPPDCLRANAGPNSTQALRTEVSPDGVVVPERVSLATQRIGLGAWSYFGDQRSVVFGPWIYTGWITTTGLVRVGRFKPGAAKPVQTVTLGRTGSDDHNNPSLMVTSKGRIAAFFSPHSGRYLPHGTAAQLYYRFTEKPGAIKDWTPAKPLPVNAPGQLGFTYPNPIGLSADKTFLAWRGGCWKPTFALREGTTWGPAREIVQGPSGQRPYAKYAAGLPGSGVVHMCYTESHPKQSRTGIHCLEYKDRRFSKADGTRVAGLSELPIPAANGDSVYPYDPKLGKAWVMDVGDDGQGRPVVLFSVGYYRTWQRFMYGRWTGTRWQVTEITPAFSDNKQRHTAGLFETGGMTLDPQDPGTVYLGRVIDHRAKVEKWVTPDQGLTWQRAQRISPTGQNCFRPTATVLKGGTTVLMVCGTLRSWTSFDTKILAVTLGPPGSTPPPADPTPNRNPPVTTPAVPSAPAASPTPVG
ncbi:BNR-4 repeat-containing protein [Patulibacter minatonensis]|uniref:BNR-4 repeat-containing protein n=1 Tax=Patulibacter minatonensis TaxID=298163 RepID=UPI00047D041F|nr:BNR-4 repeat-containing protein [Patulibacter minatonensis]